MHSVKNTVILTLILLTAGLHASGQQRAITSTYMFNGLMINPAYAGSLNVLSITGVHRDQWVNVDGAPQFQALSAHTSLMSNRIGVGLVASKDQVGVHEDVGLYGSYAYKIRTSVGILAMGLQGGFNSRRSNFTLLTLLDTNDPALIGQQTNFSPNVGAGLYFANQDWFLGVSVPYILENKLHQDVPNIEDIVVDIRDRSFIQSRESRYYYATAGGVLHLSPKIKLNPSVLLRYQEQAPFSFDLNANVIFDEIAYAGVSVRRGGDITFLAQLILNENFRVGYAYDAITNDLNDYSAGSHEILLNYRIKLRNYKKDPQCPVYF
ncbi:MAG: type IX secretion system membrane protein PorP/SprF [Bacteroidota bacterium]